MTNLVLDNKQVSDIVGDDSISLIYEEYKKVHLKYRNGLKYKLRPRLRIKKLLAYCSRLIPIAQKLARFSGVYIGRERLKKRLRGVLEIYVRNIYTSRYMFIRQLLLFLIKQFKKESEKRQNKLPRQTGIKIQPVQLESNQWIQEVRDTIIGQLRFTGKDLEVAKKFLDYILNQGVVINAEQYIRDAIFVLLRKALLQKFGPFPWRVMNSRLQIVSRLLWKY